MLRSLPAAARTASELFAPTGQEEADRFGDLPLAGVCRFAYGPKWSAWQGDLYPDLPVVVHRRTGDRSHDIHLRHPDLVVEAVLQALHEVLRRHDEQQ